MKNLFLIPFCSLSIVCFAQQNFIQYAQPITGTAASKTPAALKHGEGTELYANTIPAVTLPFAMTQFTPQTRITEKKCVVPYYYKDEKLSGFRASHWLSGSCTQDYGSVTIMPITGKLNTTSSTYQTNFSHASEISTPAYYKVDLPAYQIQTQLTASLRCGFLNFTINTNDSVYILITPNSDYNKGFIQYNAATNEIVGYNPVHRIYQGSGKPAGFNGFFVIQLQQVFTTQGCYSNDQLFNTNSISNQPNIGVYIGMKATKGTILQIKIGTSFTSIDEARKNINAEIKHWNFDETKIAAEKIWNKALGQIEISTKNEADKTIFYTALYHTMQQPRLMNDVSGSYPKFATQYQTATIETGKNYYDDFSMWDIYRTELPLYEILQPNLINDFVHSLIIKYKQGGWLPNFPCWNSYTSAMIGDHGAAFIASAFTKGITNYNVNDAYEAMRKNAFEVPETKEYKDGKGRRSLTNYLKYGYYPLDDEVRDAFHPKEQVSRTLEYAYNDYCVGMVAKALGKKQDAEILLQRSKNFENVFDTTVGFVNGKFINGSFFYPFTPDKRVPLKNSGINFITEGTPRQYTFYVPHNIEKLTELMGGVSKLEQHLDSIFYKKRYWHGNEPGHQIPFMYNYTKSPYKTQLQVNSLLREEYGIGAGGLSGNDDAGQMSAWYVMASLGLYPVDPVSDNYALTASIFQKAIIHLPNGKLFTITNNNANNNSFYISQILLNGKVYNNFFLTHQVLLQGGNLQYNTSNKPFKP